MSGIAGYRPRGMLIEYITKFTKSGKKLVHVKPSRFETDTQLYQCLYNIVKRQGKKNIKIFMLCGNVYLINTDLVDEEKAKLSIVVRSYQ